jgi:hypothetical protein
VKHRRTIFHARVGPVWFPQKTRWTHNVKHVFLYLVGSAGHVLRSDVFGHEMSMHYFPCLAKPDIDSTKSALGDITPKLCFSIRSNLRVT